MKFKGRMKEWGGYSAYWDYELDPADFLYCADEQTLLDEVYDKLATSYDGEVIKETIIDGAKKGIADSLGDTYTVYMNAKEAEEFENDLHGNVGAGIGVGLIGAAALNAAGRNPEKINDYRTLMVLAIAFADALAIIGLVVAIVGNAMV